MSIGTIVIDRLAQAAYMANHNGPGAIFGGRSAPVWDDASLETKNWVRRQIRAVLIEAESLGLLRNGEQ